MLIDVGVIVSLGEFNLSGNEDLFSMTLVGYIYVAAATFKEGYIISNCSRKEQLSEIFLLPTTPTHPES